jgi:hypothetical protein
LIQISQKFDVVGNVGNSQIIVNLLLPMHHGSNAKTLGLTHLQFPDMGVSSGPPDGTHVVLHGTDELLVQQNTIPDGQTTSPVYESSQDSQSLCSFLSHLINMNRPGKPFIKGYSKIMDGIDQLDWLPEKLTRSGFQDMPTCLSEEHG